MDVWYRYVNRLKRRRERAGPGERLYKFYFNPFAMVQGGGGGGGGGQRRSDRPPSLPPPPTPPQLGLGALLGSRTYVYYFAQKNHTLSYNEISNL